MGLQALPPEILLQICELFCEHCQKNWLRSGSPIDLWRCERDFPRKHLLKLSLVCKSLRPFAQRVLHHHFGFVEYGTAHLALFCRTICNKPELGKYLRWAELSARPNVPELEGIVQGWLPKAVDKFSRHLSNGAQELPVKSFLAPLVLLQAPNLEHLYYNGFELQTHDAGIRSGALPSNLKSINMGGTNPFAYNEIMDLSWDGVEGFIETFNNLGLLSVHHAIAPSIDERISFQSLHTLRLYKFIMPREDLENLISHMPKLEEFRMYRNYWGLFKCATTPEILHVLAQRNDTLRRLELRISCTHDNVALLKTLTKLEELEIMVGNTWHAEYSHRTTTSKQALIGIMPPSLRKLTVFPGDPNGLEEASDALMTYISSTYRENPHDQRLQTVHFDFLNFGSEWSHRQRDTFRQGCQEWAKNGILVFH